MYIYKFVITYEDGSFKHEWLSHNHGETIAELKDRADRYIDELEHREGVTSVKMTRRTVPGI